MDVTAGGRSELLERVCLDALSRDIPRAVVEEARGAVISKFTGVPDDGARAEAYFWGVVRRRAMRGQAPSAATTLLVASLASELAEAGHSPGAVFDTLTRVYAPVVGAQAIEGYRPVPVPGRAA